MVGGVEGGEGAEANTADGLGADADGLEEIGEDFAGEIGGGGGEEGKEGLGGVEGERVLRGGGKEPLGGGGDVAEAGEGLLHVVETLAHTVEGEGKVAHHLQMEAAGAGEDIGHLAATKGKGGGGEEDARLVARACPSAPQGLKGEAELAAHLVEGGDPEAGHALLATGVAGGGVDDIDEADARAPRDEPFQAGDGLRQGLRCLSPDQAEHAFRAFKRHGCSFRASFPHLLKGRRAGPPPSGEGGDRQASRACAGGNPRSRLLNPVVRAFGAAQTETLVHRRDGGRQDPMAHRQDAFENAQGAGGREGVAEVGLRRAHGKQGDVRAAVARGVGQKRKFGVVLLRDAGGVHLPVVDVAEGIGETAEGTVQGAAETLAQATVLRWEAGDDGTAVEAGVGVRAVASDVGEAPEHKGGAALAGERALGPGDERLEGEALREGDEGRLAGHLRGDEGRLERDDDGDIALAEAEGVGGGVETGEDGGLPRGALAGHVAGMEGLCEATRHPGAPGKLKLSEPERGERAEEFVAERVDLGVGRGGEETLEGLHHLADDVGVPEPIDGGGVEARVVADVKGQSIGASLGGGEPGVGEGVMDELCGEPEVGVVPHAEVRGKGDAIGAAGEVGSEGGAYAGKRATFEERFDLSVGIGLRGRREEALLAEDGLPDGPWRRRVGVTSAQAGDGDALAFRGKWVHGRGVGA